MHYYLKWFITNLFPNKCIICRAKNSILCPKHRVKKRKNNQIKLKNSNLNLFVFANYHDANNAQIMHYFKYYGFKNLSSIFVKDINSILPTYILSINNLLVIPVPIHWTRFLWRGFNQSHLIAKKLSQKNKNFKLTDNNLIKYKKTRPQATLNKNERSKNIKNTFNLKYSAQIKNKNILIIDDVTTTGETLKEIQKILVQAGAKDIYALTYLIIEK